ncbi:hypothetical protein Q9L58_006481 [Maublancomyces gigas]|uniref:Kinesin motor domain-containing protein n=1 Tax=Discina gigas TaxID=1032678 RepID=A0ABR3GF87_9PEZI
MNTVRIIARVRPLLNGEINKDVVVHAEGTTISMPNPKNENENFTFPFNAVHNMESSQTHLFAEVSSTVKHLFGGNDVTIFAYGATGSGKTYTMRGEGASTERGIIPRLLAAIYRRGTELERKTVGKTTMIATMSYYEIYNDKVFDLFVSPDKRTLSGLPLRDNGGKTVVVGLVEKEIKTAMEFEKLYSKANTNRSTSATKLNAHSSRSHAIVCVRVATTNCETGERRAGTISCIDLAGSEDNRRTANDKERMTESASINKSLFVLAQCVEAMTKKQNRIPYRESKMTRILSLGQNNGLTVMILNLAPTKAFHMDTLSALNFANRAKKIELKPADTDYILPDRPIRAFGTTKGNIQPLTARSLGEKSQGATRAPLAGKSLHKLTSSGMSKIQYEQNIDDLVAKKVEEILTARGLNEPVKPPLSDMDDIISKRLELLEKRVDKKADVKTEGLTYAIMAKQHVVCGESSSALKMYQLALEYFPGQQKLMDNIATLRREKSHINAKSEESVTKRRTSFTRQEVYVSEQAFTTPMRTISKKAFKVFTDNENSDFMDSFEEEGVEWEDQMDEDYVPPVDITQTPRTAQLLDIVNSEDIVQIMKLKGVGKKRAEAMARHVRELREASDEDGDFPAIKDLQELGMIRGISKTMVDNMRGGLMT